MFKPTTVTGLVSEEEDRNWDEAKLRRTRAIHGQLELFEDNDWRKTFEVIPKPKSTEGMTMQQRNGR